MRRTFSLRTYLLALVIGTMLPAIVVAAVLVRRVVSDNREAIQRRLLETARATAADVDAEFAGTIRTLQGLGESDRLTNAEFPAFYDQAARVLATQPVWSAITLSTPDGRQILNTSRPLGESLPAVVDRESFDRVRTRRVPAIGGVHVGELSHQFGFLVRVPVVRRSQVVYVLSAWITTRQLHTVLERQSPLTDEWVRGIVDPTGVLAARSKEEDRFVGQKGTRSFLDRYAAADAGVYQDVALDGTPVVGAFARGPASGWIAGVAVPLATVTATFRRSMLALGLVALLLLGGGTAGSYVISRRLKHGIVDATTEAEAIAGGEPRRQPRSGVTEIQRLLDALNRSATLLEHRQRERDEQVARADLARAEAEAADRAKDEFLAMLGHELRNPLAPALTALHLMKMRIPEQCVRERAVLERQIRHMSRLVDDLLDISRLRRGAIELRRERFDLAEAVANAVEMTTPLFAEKLHDLEVDTSGAPDGLIVDGDRIRLAQVMANILSNAAKYTEARGHIVVTLTRDGDYARFECQDDGIGISPSLVPRVFDSFVQGQRGLDRPQGGLGLGLAVARALVKLHHGTIEAASEGVNRGTRFIVRLPLAPSRVAAAASPDPRSRSSQERPEVGTVLVVDDNSDALEMLLEALRSAGIHAVGASSGAEALDLDLRIIPEVAVLDIGLPGMDGYDLARTLRARRPQRNMVLIALTGYGQSHDAQAAKAAGFDAFFVKPIDVLAFIDAVTDLAAKSRSS